MRDENGFKCHVASESHVRQMQIIGEDPRKAINEFSNQFMKDFIQLLRTGHGEKKVNVNHFYQEYISNKQHIHMNATKWASLTEFAKHLGREGICRVEEDEKNESKTGASGLMISWIDNSPEALRRQETLRKKERQDRGDEEREQRMIKEQIRRAKRDAGSEHLDLDDESGDDDATERDDQGIKRKDGEKIVLNFGAKKQTSPVDKPPTPPLSDKEESTPDNKDDLDSSKTPSQPADLPIPTTNAAAAKETGKPTLSFGLSTNSIKPKNVFATSSKKNAFSSAKKGPSVSTQRPMSEAERIMKEEIERKRQRDLNGGNAFKRQRVS